MRTLPFIAALLIFACEKKDDGIAPEASQACLSRFGENTEWRSETEVIINGYSQNAMEPKPSKDQVVLFWNDKPSSDDQMNIHYAVKNGSGVYQYKGTVTGTVSPTFLDGVPAVDENGNFYFISTRNYASSNKTVFSGLINVTGPDTLEVLSTQEADTNITANTGGTLEMDLDVSWDGTLAVVSRATFAGNPYPETSFLKYFNISSRVLQVRSDSDSVFQNINFSDCRAYAASLSRDNLEVYFTVVPSGVITTLDNFRIAVAKRTSINDPFTNPQIIKAIAGQAVEGPAPTFDDQSKTLFYHRFDSVSGKYKIYKVIRN